MSLNKRKGRQNLFMLWLACTSGCSLPSVWDRPFASRPAKTDSIATAPSANQLTADFGSGGLTLQQPNDDPTQSSLAEPKLDTRQTGVSPATAINTSSPVTWASPIATSAVEPILGDVAISVDASTEIPGVSDSSTVQSSTAIPLNLPSVFAAVDGHHPVVGLAQWQVQEAYANLSRAQVLWLPTIQSGFSFHRHDGNYQASNGQIVDVNRNSFQYGLGNSATGAGTTPQPGILLQVHLADAIFQPRIAKKTAWAQGHAANATKNRQLLTAAQAYFDLLAAHQDLSIAASANQRLVELAKITTDFAETGQGLQADADRLNTELLLGKARLIDRQEGIAVASSRLTQAISLDPACRIQPVDSTLLPLPASRGQDDVASLIGFALANRPELKESQALVAAACDAYTRQRKAPFIPSVLLGFSTTGFGGGLGNNLANVDSRYDFDAALTWRVRNLGLGESAARRQHSAQVQQARYAKLQVLDSVAAQVAEAHAQVTLRQQQLDLNQQAIAAARDSYERNLARIRDGQGLPIEVLQSLQALESAERAYMNAVLGFNQAQLTMQWALGWPVDAIEQTPVG